jgi:hypothetical protein
MLLGDQMFQSLNNDQRSRIVPCSRHQVMSLTLMLETQVVIQNFGL